MIVDWQGRYWTTRPCEVIEYMVDDAERFPELYPSCEPYISGEDPHHAAAVHANLNDPSSAAEAAAALEIGFVAALLIAFVTHAVAVELYVSVSAAELTDLPGHDRLQA